VYIAVVVVVASVAGGSMAMTGRGRPTRVEGVPVRTVRRWLVWWRTVFALGSFWSEARAYFAEPVEVARLPQSLLRRFGMGDSALEKLLRFIAPITTTSSAARISMAA
jgi:hypothetical protein